MESGVSVDGYQRQVWVRIGVANDKQVTINRAEKPCVAYGGTRSWKSRSGFDPNKGPNWENLTMANQNQQNDQNRQQNE